MQRYVIVHLRPKELEGFSKKIPAKPHIKPRYHPSHPLLLLYPFLTTNYQSRAFNQIFNRSPSFRLSRAGARISFYSFCDPLTYGRAVYFRKDQDSTLHRLTMANLRVAVSDNRVSTRQLKIASKNISIGIGLVAAGIALTTIGIITTINHNHALSNAYDQASAQWYAEAQTNFNTPMPSLPHYSGPSALFYIGAATTLSCMIPLFNVANHTRKAVDIYNGIP